MIQLVTFDLMMQMRHTAHDESSHCQKLSYGNDTVYTNDVIAFSILLGNETENVIWMISVS